jgi:hypothetical protein
MSEETHILSSIEKGDPRAAEQAASLTAPADLIQAS